MLLEERFSFLQTAEMLRPTISNVEDELAEHFPHLVLFHNKTQIDDYTPNRFKTMQQVGYFFLKQNKQLYVFKTKDKQLLF